MKHKRTVILCSGVALGVYIPAVALKNRLMKQGVHCQMFILENLIHEKKQKSILENKKAFHQNFKLALLGQRMSTDFSSNIDPVLLEALFQGWQSEGIDQFIVFSGFWMPILADYSERPGVETLSVSALHMDADISSSWKRQVEFSDLKKDVWFFHHGQGKVLQFIRSVSETPIPWEQRHERIMVHGGGWGMGTYQKSIPVLEFNGFRLDILTYQSTEIDHSKTKNRYYLVNPDWNPWEKGADGNYTYPPVSEVLPGQEMIYHMGDEHHRLFDIFKANYAVVSKPGGSSLMDSLNSATPIVFMDPFGDYETKNAELWVSLGLGIYWNDWKESDFNLDKLKKCHENLLNYWHKLPDYLDVLTGMEN